MSDEIKNKDEEERNPVSEFTEKMISAPCFALAGTIAMYITFKEYIADGNMPATFLAWLGFFGTILFYSVGVILALFLVYIIGLLIVGGIAPNIDMKYINIVITIIILVVVYYYMYQFLVR